MLNPNGAATAVLTERSRRSNAHEGDFYSQLPPLLQRAHPCLDFDHFEYSNMARD